MRKLESCSYGEAYFFDWMEVKCKVWMFEIFVSQEETENIHKSYLLTNFMMVERNQIKIQRILSFTNLWSNLLIRYLPKKK